MLINEGSCIQGNYQLENAEGTVTLDVPIYNGCWDAAGHALTRIDATPTVSPSSDSEGNSAILAYTFGPDGAHFNPPLVLTLKYDSPSLADYWKTVYMLPGGTEVIGKDLAVH